jgi:hypothetical protein
VLDKKIGRGSFGEVYKCHWRGTTIAVKVLTDQAMNDETLLEFQTGPSPPRGSARSLGAPHITPFSMIYCGDGRARPAPREPALSGAGG